MLNFDEYITEEQEWNKKRQDYMMIYYQINRLKMLLGNKCTIALRKFFDKYSIKRMENFIAECRYGKPNPFSMQYDLNCIEESFHLHLYRVDHDALDLLLLSNLKLDESSYYNHIESFLSILWRQIKDCFSLSQNQIYEWVSQKANIDPVVPYKSLFKDKSCSDKFLLTLYRLMLG